MLLQEPSDVPLSSSLVFPRGSVVKNPPAMQKMQETWVRSLGWEDPLEEGMATHSSILAWRILGYSPWGCKESDMTEATEHSCIPVVQAFSLIAE